LLKNDPNLALASLRIDIETKLREIARKENLPVADESFSLEKVLYALYSKKVIGSSEFDIIRIIISACDRAVHAEKIDFVTASQIVDIGESAVSYIDSLREKS